MAGGRFSQHYFRIVGAGKASVGAGKALRNSDNGRQGQANCKEKVAESQREVDEVTPEAGSQRQNARKKTSKANAGRQR